jgi:hypothetical protein
MRGSALIWKNILAVMVGVALSVAAASTADANTVYTLGLTDLNNFIFGTSTASGTVVFDNFGDLAGGNITVVGDYTYDFTGPSWSQPSQFPSICVLGPPCSNPGNAYLELGPLLGAPPNSPISIDLTYVDDGGILTFSGIGVLTIAPTPLPPTWTMMLIGLAGLGFMGCLQSKKAALPAAS